MNFETIQMNKYCNDFHNGENIFFCKIDLIHQELSFLSTLNRNVILIVSSGDITFTENHLINYVNHVSYAFFWIYSVHVFVHSILQIKIDI